MVSGCFDLLHRGYVAYLEAAAEYGQLMVAIGSDKAVLELNGRPSMSREAERLYQVAGLRCFISRGSGRLDFEADLRLKRPDVFVVNEDGDRPEKRELGRELGIAYHVGSSPSARFDKTINNLPGGSASLPYRIDLAGAWLDQPVVSRLYPGAVVVVASFQRYGLKQVQDSQAARGALRRSCGVQGCRTVRRSSEAASFGCDNPPGTRNMSGSQDALGILLHRVRCLHYAGDFWPEESSSCKTQKH